MKIHFLIFTLLLMTQTLLAESSNSLSNIRDSIKSSNFIKANDLLIKAAQGKNVTFKEYLNLVEIQTLICVSRLPVDTCNKSFDILITKLLTSSDINYKALEIAYIKLEQSLLSGQNINVYFSILQKSKELLSKRATDFNIKLDVMLIHFYIGVEAFDEIITQFNGSDKFYNIKYIDRLVAYIKLNKTNDCISESEKFLLNNTGVDKNSLFRRYRFLCYMQSPSNAQLVDSDLIYFKNLYASANASTAEKANASRTLFYYYMVKNNLSEAKKYLYISNDTSVATYKLHRNDFTIKYLEKNYDNLYSDLLKNINASNKASTIMNSTEDVVSIILLAINSKNKDVKTNIGLLRSIYDHWPDQFKQMTKIKLFNEFANAIIANKNKKDITKLLADYKNKFKAFDEYNGSNIFYSVIDVKTDLNKK